MVSHLFWGLQEINFHGAAIEVNPGDKLGYFAYFFDDYCALEIESLVEACREAKVFVDVGANQGWFSLAVARLCPQIKVVAFEPSQEMAARFRKGLKRNPEIADRIELVEKAVGGVDGTATFVPSYPLNPGIGRIVGEVSMNQRKARASKEKRYPVAMTRLDSFFDQVDGVDVMKIDVEGSELAVLEGMDGLIARKQPRTLLIETHGFYLPGETANFNASVLRQLRASGFDVFVADGMEWKVLGKSLGTRPRAHLLARRQDVISS